MIINDKIQDFISLHLTKIGGSLGFYLTEKIVQDYNLHIGDPMSFKIIECITKKNIAPRKTNIRIKADIHKSGSWGSITIKKKTLELLELKVNDIINIIIEEKDEDLLKNSR